MRFASSAWPMVLLILCAPGVIQVFALQVDLRAAQLLAPALRVIDRARAADVVLQLALELGDELRIVLILRVGIAQLLRARASASRRRTCRHRGQSGRVDRAGRRASCSQAFVRGAHGRDEPVDACFALDARRVFDSAADIDGIGPKVPDGVADIVGTSGRPPAPAAFARRSGTRDQSKLVASAAISVGRRIGKQGCRRVKLAFAV